MPEVVVDIAQAVKALEKMSEAGKNLRPAFAKMRGPMRADQSEHAKAESGPDGRWPGLAPSTLAKRQAAGRRRHLGKKRSRGGIYRKSRKLLGKLPPAFRVTVSKKEIRATWKAPWSSVHQDGTARVPRRQFGWISDGLVKTGADIIVAHVIDGFAKGAR